MNRSSEPIFNIPAVVIATIAVLAGVHALRAFVFDARQDYEFLLLFSFLPARYDTALLLQGGLPGGFGAQIWTFFSYAFIHADFVHLGMNAAWFLPFGSAVARRLGAMRFLLLFLATAAAGAFTYLIANPGSREIMIGASASVSGMMAAAIRFVFPPSGPIALWQRDDESAYRLPAQPLTSALRDPRILTFLVIWFGLNLLFGLRSLSLAGEGQSVAWEAHIGGFLAGLVLFSLFDPVPRSVTPPQDPGEMPQ